MDGTQMTVRSLRQTLCSIVCIGAVLAMPGGQQTRADVPPRLQIEGIPQPLNPLPRSEAGTGWQPRKSRTAPQRATILRPRGRVIHVDKPVPIAPSAQIVRPPARVLVHPNRVTVRKLSGTTDANAEAAVTTLAYPVATSSLTRSATVEEALDSKGSITFRKTPLSEVVFLLSDLWHINIVAGENVSGEVSGSFHDAPLREVLSAALTATGYSYRQTGNSLIVLPIEQVGADDPSFTSTTINIPPALKGDDSMLEAAQLLLSQRGQLRKIGDSSMLIVDSPEKIARVRQLFADFSPSVASIEPESAIENRDDPTSAATANIPGLAPTAVTQSGIAYFTPQFTEAEELVVPLREAMGESVIVAAYPQENRIMVRGTGDDLRIAREAIEQLDRPRSQVRITAMIYDVSLKEIERLGVNWSTRPHSRSLALSDMNDPDSLRFRNFLHASTDLITDPSAPGAANFAISTINDSLNVDTLIQALDNNSEAKLLADPTITVGDRRQASIRIVQRIPILAADPVENSGVVFSQVQFEEAGVILNVQPRISRDGTIDMQVKPEYSVVADFIDNNPVIDSRTAETTVRVGNGQMFVLGGLRQKSIVESVRGVPFLKDIKFVGKLFRSHDTEIRESELIVFLKPEVITPYEAGTARQRQAACVSTQQLDAIPHATRSPMTPCCRDPECPNHHPRPRVNGGSRSLEMLGGSGSGAYEVYGTHEVQIIEDVVVEPTDGDQQSSIERTSETEQRAEVIHEVYPPLHIDPRVLTTR